MAFSAIDKAPGVYIDEIKLPGAIPGVSTSVAAFVGPTLFGPTNEPTHLTSYTQFQNAFGEHPNQSVYTHSAVKAFFDNGGANCFVVQAGPAQSASLTLLDGNGAKTLVVTARQAGIGGNDLKISIGASSLVSAVPVHRDVITIVAASGNQVTASSAADAAKFRPGDAVFIDDGTNSERASVNRTSGATVFLVANLANSYAAGATLRIADIDTSQTRVRLNDVSKIEPGTYLSLTDGTNTDNLVVAAVEQANKAVTFKTPPGNVYKMAAADPAVTVTSHEFDLVVTFPDSSTESHTGLSMAPGHSHYFKTAIPDTSVIKVDRSVPPSFSNPPKNIPAAIAAPGTNLTGGVDNDLTLINASHFKTAIDTLEKIDEVTILCVPGRSDPDVQSHMIEHCERMQDRFAILDSQLGAVPDDVAIQRNLLASDKGFAALYYPWIVVSDPTGTDKLLLPPSGFVAGVYARTDDERGVHKAPANEPVLGALDLERNLSDNEQGPLNEIGVNVIRRFPGTGIRVWGARTIATSTQWRYVNVRRLTLFIEESIQEGTVFAVFEPNTEALWKKVKFQVDEFLTRVWRDGALFGSVPERAFRVRVDEDLNPPGVRALGQLVVEVSFVPATPAEFVVFRIIQDPTGAILQEA